MFYIDPGAIIHLWWSCFYLIRSFLKRANSKVQHGANAVWIIWQKRAVVGHLWMSPLCNFCRFLVIPADDSWGAPKRPILPPNGPFSLPGPLFNGQFARFYINCNILETALLITKTQFQKHFSIQTTQVKTTSVAQKPLSATKRCLFFGHYY